MQKHVRKSVRKLLTILLTMVIIVSMTPRVTAAGQSSANKLNSLGLLANISEDELQASLTRDIGLTMILKALGYENEDALLYEGQSPFKDTEGWSKGWASLAYHLNITAGTSKTTFTPGGSLSEREFLTFLLRALGYGQAESYNNTVSLAQAAGLIDGSHTIKSSNYRKEDAANAMYNALSARVLSEDVILANILIGKGLFTLKQAVNLGLKDGELEILKTSVISPHEIEITFSHVVDPNKFFFEIETPRGTYNLSSIWDNVNTSVKLVTVADLEAGTYQVTANQIFNGITKYTKAVTVKPYSDLNVEIVSSAVELKNNAKIAYLLKNTYGQIVYNLADQISVEAINITRNKALTISVIEDSNGYYIDLVDLVGQGAKLGDQIEVSLIYNDDVTKKVLTCTNDTDIETLILYSPQDNNGRLEQNTFNYVLNYTALSKEGVMLNLPLHYSNQDGVFDQETIGDFVITSSNPIVVNVDTMRVSETGQLTFSVGNIIGPVEIMVLNKRTNVRSTVNLAVYLESVLTEVEVAESSNIVVAGDTIEVAATGYDQFGALMDIGYVSGLTVVSTDTSVVPKYTVKLKDNVFTYKGIAEGDSKIKLYNSSGKVLLETKLTIEEASIPQTIVSVTMPEYFETDYDATYTLAYDNLVVYDQYANVYDMTENKERIKISYDDDTDDVLSLGKASFTGGSLEVNAKEEEGTGTYTFSIDGDEDTEFSLDITTVDPDDITKYEMADIEEITVGLLNTKTTELKGYLSNGESVVISTSTIEAVTSSNPSLASVTFDENEITVEGVEGGDGGIVTISAWSDGEVIATATASILEDEDDDDDEDDD